jgi:hypothetical protein
MDGILARRATQCPSRLQIKRLARFSMILPLLLCGGFGCGKSLGYSFKLKEPSPSAILVNEQIVDHVHDLARGAKDAYASYLVPEVHSASDPDQARRDRLVEDGDATATLVDATVCGRLQPVASFVHLSDVQLKETSVNFEPAIARLHPSTNRNDSLELYGYGTFLSTVLSANELEGAPGTYTPCPDPLPPQFAIHTGDAIDASMFSELFQFLAVVNEFEIPFFNVIGNHDDLFFGTLPAAKMSGFNVIAPFVPVHGYRRFMRAHHFEASRWDMSIPAATMDEHDPTTFGETQSTTVLDFPQSFFHGFDLGCNTQNQRGLCREADGYYATSYRVQGPQDGSEPITIRLIVLNTFEWPPGSVIGAIGQRSLGRMRDTQFTWLEGQLEQSTPGRSVTMVFGHHPFGSFTGGGGERLRRLLTNTDHVVAFFAGHTHTHEVLQHRRAGVERPLWEVIGGANISYPQFGVHVELLEDSENPSAGYIRLRSFQERLSDAPVICGQDTASTWELPCVARAGAEGARESAGEGGPSRRAEAIREANGMLAITIR